MSFLSVSKRPIRVAIFNVKYSPNLGDGIIADCLESGLKAANPLIEPYSIDLAGRSTFSNAPASRRYALLNFLEAMPSSLRRTIVPLALQVLVAFRLRKHWAKRLRGADAAVIGGGALIADTDQNFPIKLSAALTLCSRLRLPVAISHVGVSAKWSQSGRRRFLDALSKARIISATVRDRASVKSWGALVGHHHNEPGVVPDPGLLAGEVYSLHRTREDRVPCVGVCVTNPLVLRLHGEGNQESAQLAQWFAATVIALKARGYHPVLFTDGSPEDEQFKQAVKGRLEDCDGISVADRFADPSELARGVAGFDALVAHRLHACIIAYSCGVPAVGLTWDRKLDRFFESVGRERFVCDPRSFSPFETVDLLREAMFTPIDDALYKKTIAGCRDGIADLAIQLQDSVAR